MYFAILSMAQRQSYNLSRNPPNEFLTGTTLGLAADNFSCNSFGEVSQYTASYSGSFIFDVQYTRDDLGRITQKIETVEGVSTTYDYSYDTAGRLITVKKNGAFVSEYVYDANGNRITATINGVTSQGFYDLQDRMTSYGGATYTYTPNGELKTKTDSSGITSYKYDEFGNLIKVTLPDGTLVEYAIDGNNRRVGKKINGALVQGFLYKDDLKPIAELDGSGAVIARFVYASDYVVPDYMLKGGITYKIISDHLGSPRLIINTTDGSVAQRIDYDEYGVIINDTNPGFQPFVFAGGLYDQRTKLTRFGARDYDVQAGRWTSKDPIRFTRGDINIYRFVFSDPLNLTDPKGLYAELCNRPFYPVFIIPYARHCYIRFNGDANDTLGYDNEGVHPDPAPNKGPWSPECTQSQGNQDDDCVRREMKKCEDTPYKITGFNCCHCAEQAMKACGVNIPPGEWPNWPVNPGPQPGETP